MMVFEKLKEKLQSVPNPWGGFAISLMTHGSCEGYYIEDDGVGFWDIMDPKGNRIASVQKRSLHDSKNKYIARAVMDSFEEWLDGLPEDRELPKAVVKKFVTGFLHDLEEAE